MASTTQKVASTNTAQSLPAAITFVAGERVLGALITFETNNIRIAFDSTPTQAGLGHLMTSNHVLELTSGDKVMALKFISAVADTHGAMQVTLFY